MIMPLYLQLKLWPQTFAIIQLQGDAETPDWLKDNSFYNITRTADELSVVCEQRSVPEQIENNRNWRMLQVIGQLDFSLVGILAKIASPLAAAKISIFSISTFNTDYILIQQDQLDKAIKVLTRKGYQINQ